MRKYGISSRLMCFALAVIMCMGGALFCHAQESSGASFTDDRLVAIDRAFDSVPLTFEAWVYVPKSQSARAGVVFGNYRGSANVPSINFEIHKNGRPRLYIVDTERNAHDFTFSADVRTGDYAHVAIVCNTAAGSAYCYINGKLAATKSGKCTPEPETIARSFLIGADYRSGNAQYFKGNIRSVSLYSSARSASEIAQDMKGTDTDSSSLIASFEANDSALFTDKSKNAYRTEQRRIWFTDKEPVDGYSYSFCIVGDTQKVVYKEPDKLSCIYDWIVENRDSRKIEYVFGLGDITDKNTEAEWLVAQREIGKLDGVVPYSLVRGNHDGSDNYNRYMRSEAYKSSIAGSYHPTKIENTWREFTVGGVKYLNITLDYGASDAVLNWADRIIAEHPEHRVIITTHAYLYRDGTTLDYTDVCPPNATGEDNGTKNNGDQMWDKLISKHENIFLVLSGHDPCDDVVITQTEGVHGNVVTQMLVDPQGVDNALGSTGMITMLYFSEDGEHVTVETYSTVKEQYYLSTNQTVIDIPRYKWSENDGEQIIPGQTDAEQTTSDTSSETQVQSPDGKRTSSPVLPAVISVAAGAAVGVCVGVLVMKRKNKEK